MVVFGNKSTNIKITSYQLDLGCPMIKLINKSSKIFFGTSRGWSKTLNYLINPPKPSLEPLGKQKCTFVVKVAYLHKLVYKLLHVNHTFRAICLKV